MGSNINKVLTLELSTSVIEEGADNRLMVKLNRSGSWSSAETFTLTADTDSRLAIPTEVTIAAGQSGTIFYIELADDNVLQDNDSTAITISVAGNDYPTTTQRLTIVDNELPTLSISSSKTDINEGETFQLTITTSRTSANPIAITLSSETVKRFSLPINVTIPAGETLVTVDVTAVEDEVPSADLTNAFSAVAPRHQSAQVLVILHDNDMPVLELTLTPDKVSENVGVVSVAGVLRRTTNKDSKITVKISDDAEGKLYFGNRTLELAKGVEEVHFNFGPVDNAEMEGDRTYTVTAAVWLSSCSCSASGTSAGSVAAQLQVFDDDGPALQLASSLSTVKKGDKTTLTITRNTATDKDLTVTLSSDYDDNLTYNHTVTIPAGQKSVEVEVTSAKNDISGDTHTVVFTVQTEGYSKGTCYIMVTDQTLPDALISSITADASNLEVGEKVMLTITINNNGAAELPAEVPVRIYLRGNSTAIGTVYTNETIEVGAMQTINKTITLPTIVGSHSYYAVVNELNTVKELSYNNNTSADVTINTTSPFTVNVSTDKTVYKQGDKVVISGQLSGSGIAETDIEIYLINESARQVQTAKTDANGAFTYEWQLFGLQSGHFAVGACYPGEGLNTEMATFDVYGLRRTEYRNITCDVIMGDTYTGSIEIINPGNLNLTGCSVEMLSVPETCKAQLSIPATIAGGHTVQLSYSLEGIKPTVENKWEEIKARVNTSEGVSLDATIYFYCRNAQAKLVASTKNLVTTMTKGKTREYNIQVSNIGRGNTGKITLALPDFIKSLAGNILPSQNQNDTLNIPLSFTPSVDMQLNVPVTGQIGVNCENGEGVAVTFSITPVSDDKGTLIVEVCDEYTYYTNEAPHVENASIILRNPITGAIVAESVTGKNGMFSIELPEGYYNLAVTSPNHDSYQSNILVNPGIETRQLINLSVQAIRIDWKVEETDIEDEYDIITKVSYETNVPIPVVVVDVPQSIPADELAIGESLIFDAIATNKGLIAAKGFTLEMPDDVEHLLFEPLTEYQDLTLIPNQSIIIPIRVTRLPVGNNDMEKVRRRIDVMNILRCIASILPRYYWDCGTDRKWHRYKTSFKIGKCKMSDPEIVKVEISTPPPIIIRDPDPNGGTIYGGTWSNDTIRTMKYEGCEPCQNRTLLTMIDCGLSLVSRYKQLKGVINCAISAIETAEVLTDKDKGLRQKAAAFLGTIVSCKNAIVTGKGDKNKTRQQQREQAIETLIDLLADITSKIGQDDFDAVKDWDNVIDMIASASSIVKDLAGFDYDDVEELLCPLKLLRPCDYKDDDLYDEGNKHGVAKVRRSSTMSYPSYLTGYRHAVSYGALDMMVFTGLRKEFYGNINWLDCNGEQLNNFMQTFLLTQDENGIVNDSMLEELEAILPEGMSVTDMKLLVERWNNTINDIDSENKINIEKSLNFSHLIEVVENLIHSDGYADLDECISSEHEKAIAQLNEANSSVCATISLQISQKLVLTRQAFRGTLTVFNGNEDVAMENVKLTLNVTNKTTGQVATSHEFQINAESLNGFSGELDLGSGWTLDANSTGTATILFIPTKYAAPNEPVEWSFGGTLSYIDPFTGLEVTRDLYPVTLTVKPSPDLDLLYFMQRDVYGDDPLTADVEAILPAEFALLINNKGNGDATNVRMVTRQPEIIENEKGLAIDFELLSSQVNGGDATLSFGHSIANNFGTIPAHSQMYAQWWLQSSLLGHFTDYKVEANHVTSYGNEDLSLLDEVTIHELIHGFTANADGNVPMRGFLVNDITDAEDMPDIIYFTDATQQAVTITKNLDISKLSDTDTEYLLTVSPDQNGWNYGSRLDPTNGRQRLVSVTRQSDGKVLPVDNFWQTDRTLRDGKDWLYENRLHFVGEINEDSESYLLTFEPKPDVELAVESYVGVPNEDTVQKEQLTEVTVKFNKPIVESSFTTDDITLNCQGEHLDATKIEITKVTDTEYRLGLNEVTLADGYYVLTVQTAGISDTEGFNGATGKQATWIQFVDGKVSLAVSVSPVEGGTVTPTSGCFEYNSDVKLKAVPAEGYDFVGWTEYGETVSSDTEYTHHLIGNTNLTAQFVIKHYTVNIGYDWTQGVVEGAASGIYDYGTLLELIAKPNEGYIFDAWSINGENAAGDAKYTLKVDGNMDIDALFKEEVTTGLASMSEETLKVRITPLPLGNWMYLTGNFHDIQQVNVFDMSGVKRISKSHVITDEGIYTGHLTPGIYFIVISTDRGIYRTKVVKQ